MILLTCGPFMLENIAKTKKETDSQAENNLVVTSWEDEVDRAR